MLNPRHSTVPATRKEINSILVKSRRSFLILVTLILHQSTVSVFMAMKRLEIALECSSGGAQKEVGRSCI